MILTLTRRWYTAKSTVGELFIGGARECFILERPDLNNQPEVSCIPEGVYSITTHYSNHLKRWALLLKDVPNRSMIEVHPGNYVKDSLGCLLPGVVRDIDAVYSSDVAFEALYLKVAAALDNKEEVQIAISKDAK